MKIIGISPRKRALLFMSSPSTNQVKQRVIVYIDGYNFYYGLKNNSWKKYYWLDMVSFCEKFMGSNQALVGVKYFSAPTGHQYKKIRQSKFFQANKSNSRFELILGNYLNKDVNCNNCSTTFQVPEEKKTDVNIATHLISDCIYNKCDISVLISGDSDLTPPLEFIKAHNSKHIISVFFPPKRSSYHLKTIAHNVVYLEQFGHRFKTSLLSEEVEIGPNITVKRPDKWK